VLENKEQNVINSNKNMDERTLSMFIKHETNVLDKECHRISISTHLFSCMTVEAFINHYGVKRLGESFYKKNIERIGITEKLSILVLTCFNMSLQKDNELVKKIRELFNIRNQLVHPKTKEFNAERVEMYINKHPRDFLIKKYVNSMEFILEEFCTFDSGINKDFEFKKPTLDIRQ
jgi:hypothetical protein